MEDYHDLLKKLKEIKDMGYVKTHRLGNTGIGKTLEDLLGIEENNVPGPNSHMLELKSGRKNCKSMLTLFTKSPLPPRVNSTLLRNFGYSSPENGRLILHSTVTATSCNTLKGRPGFKLSVLDNRLELQDSNEMELCYWTREILRDSFERKYPGPLLYVKADAQGYGSDEKFWFNEAWFLKNFGFENFVRQIEGGNICVDIRIGTYPDGRTHDHGTAFRIFPDKLDLCFEKREQVL